MCKIFRGLSDIRGCLVGFKNKKLLFSNYFHTWKNCMYERVSEDWA